MCSQDADPVGEASRAGKPILDSDIDWLVSEVERLRNEAAPARRAAGPTTKVGGAP